MLIETQPRWPCYTLIPVVKLRPRGSAGNVPHADLFSYETPEEGKNGKDWTACYALLKILG